MFNTLDRPAPQRLKIAEMIITPVAVFDAPVRNSWGVHQSTAVRTIVQLRTAEGLVGLGESYGKKPDVEGLIAVKSIVEGSDPYQLTLLRSKIANLRAFAAIEVACLDLIGKHTGRPVCDLLGGQVRDSVPVSAYLFYKFASDDERDPWGEVMSPPAMAEMACRWVDRWGFKSLKLIW